MGKILNNFLTLIIGSIIVWFIVFFIFYNPAQGLLVDDIYGENATAVVDNTFVGNDTVTLKEDVTRDEVVLGSIYTITGTGEYFNAVGTITYKIALNTDLEIIGYIEVEYGHSGEPYKNYVINFLNELVENKVNISQFNSLGNHLDGITGPTAGNSVSLLMGMFENLKDLVYVTPTTPVEDIYGEGAIEEMDVDFVETDTIISKEDVLLDGTKVGGLYTISLTSVYQTDNPEEKTVVIKIALDNELKIVGHIEVDYGHTGAGFKRNVMNFLDGLVGNNIQDLVDLDGSTGSTNTTTGIIDILYELKALLAN